MVPQNAGDHGSHNAWRGPSITHPRYSPSEAIGATLGQNPVSLSLEAGIAVDLDGGQVDAVLLATDEPYWGDGIAAPAPLPIERLAHMVVNAARLDGTPFRVADSLDGLVRSMVESWARPDTRGAQELLNDPMPIADRGVADDLRLGHGPLARLTSAVAGLEDNQPSARKNRSGGAKQGVRCARDIPTEASTQVEAAPCDLKMHVFG